jgi:DNA-binding NtrC family response regulator
MYKPPEYPLEQLALIKKKRLDEAEKVLRTKKEALEKEQEKLRAAEKERDTVKEHKQAKLNQLREGMDSGLSSPKIHQMKQYLKIVDEKLHAQEVKVQTQAKAVQTAQEAFDAARTDFLAKQMDIEKLRIHEEEWTRDAQKQISQKEEAEHDEMGATLHENKRRKKE